MPRTVCPKCGRNLTIQHNFWKSPRGEKALYPICKDCLTRDVDIKKPSTFLWIFKELDVPFIQRIWIDICKKKYKKDPVKFSPQIAIGVYLRTMSMSQYQEYHYDDTEFLNNADRNVNVPPVSPEATEEEKKEREEAAKAAGDAVDETLDDLADIVEIDEEEVKAKKRLEEMMALKAKNDAAYVAAKSTSVTAGVEHRENEAKLKASLAAQKEIEDKFADQTDMSRLDVIPDTASQQFASNPVFDSVALGSSVDEAILSQLSQQEIQQLSMKWGVAYTPAEWIRMEDMYNKYCNEFEINVDREETLKNLCKTSVNLNRAMDIGDAAAAARFATMFDQLRKSGAFTEVQKKEDKKDYVSSIGELVAAVEKEGGPIPLYDLSVPEDKLDMTLRDSQNFLINLVKNEMGLGELIESYIAKLDQAAEQNNDSIEITQEQFDKEAEDELFAQQWGENLAASVSEEIDEMFNQVGDSNGSK